MYQREKIGTKGVLSGTQNSAIQNQDKTGKVHSILDKYDYRTELTDVFSKSGIEWLRSLSSQVTLVDKIILDTSIASIEAINQQIDTVSKEISKYAGDNKDIKILLSITGIDIFSAMLISTEIVDIKRFSTPW